ncbi:MAG: hypothetical protein NDI63_08895 [Pseudobdellovibrio sp.]|nr:hypothetical protein [Pseudobdellovibrio sp.]
MTGRPLGRKNLRSYLAADELERLKINPIEEAVRCMEELKNIAAVNIKAFEDSRDLKRRSDPGPAYLANAIRAYSEQLAVLMKLAEFMYPKLSAVAIKDVRAEEQSVTEKAISAIEIRQAILNDPFASFSESAIFDLPKGF